VVAVASAQQEFAAEVEDHMEPNGPHPDRPRADRDDIPLARLILVGDDSALANSIRRVVHAARRQPEDTVAAFNNYI
jgi:FXSXX-COOH protein